MERSPSRASTCLARARRNGARNGCRCPRPVSRDGNRYRSTLKKHPNGPRQRLHRAKRIIFQGETRRSRQSARDAATLAAPGIWLSPTAEGEENGATSSRSGTRPCGACLRRCSASSPGRRCGCARRSRRPRRHSDDVASWSSRVASSVAVRMPPLPR